MEMTAPDADLLATYWTPVLDLAGDRRIRRMLLGETIKRSDLDPDVLSATLQAHGVSRLRGEPELWSSSTARMCASRTPRRWMAYPAPSGWRGATPCPAVAP